MSTNPLHATAEPVTVTHAGQTWTITLAAIIDDHTVILQSAGDGGDVVYQAFGRYPDPYPYRGGYHIYPVGAEHITLAACRNALPRASRHITGQAPMAVRPLVHAALDGGTP